MIISRVGAGGTDGESTDMTSFFSNNVLTRSLESSNSRCIVARASSRRECRSTSVTPSPTWVPSLTAMAIFCSKDSEMVAILPPKRGDWNSSSRI